ncbi:MAG: hypothetical protein HY962_07155 [Ignavibacteriae bacterium]|nr:hypothetical protein [Ignavibacteriota bacterium]
MLLLGHHPNAEDLEAEAGLREIRAMYESLPHDLDTVRTAYLHTCDAFVGVHEVGSSNSSYWVDKFLNALGLDAGLSWCMALEQFKLRFVASIWDLPDLMAFNSGGTQACYMYYEKRGMVFTDPARLSLCDQVIWRNGLTAHGHVGGTYRIQSQTSGLIVTTNEGNTSTDEKTPGRWRDGGTCVNKEWRADKWGKWGQPRNPGRYVRGAISFEMLYLDAIKRKAA